jgi:hypothetical protein
MEPIYASNDDPYTDSMTIQVQLQDGVISLSPPGLVFVKQDAMLNWIGPAGMTAMVEFVESSPFGSVMTGDENPQRATELGRHRYLCFVAVDGKRVENLTHSGDNWGGEVEVTPTGRGS